ncbi:MAG: M23 family metallopeptidase [Bacilli bacterium]|nr:M23 family metallopeptidase [Bacilli bacterium]
MLKKNVRKALIISTYVSIVVIFIIGIFFIEMSMSNVPFASDRDYIYVSKGILDRNIPVVGNKKVIIKPFVDNDVKIVKYIYDYQAEKEKQEKSIVYYEGTYMQNSGVDFSKGSGFDVVSVLGGTVINVKEDNILGKIIEIRHSNEMISLYQSLSEVNVRKDDTVTKGQIIGKSGYSNIAKDLKDHLHFELLYKGQVVDPLDYFDKSIEGL